MKPWKDCVANKQNFPFRTLAMIVSLSACLIGSALFEDPHPMSPEGEETPFYRKGKTPKSQSPAVPAMYGAEEVDNMRSLTIDKMRLEGIILDQNDPSIQKLDFVVTFVAKWHKEPSFLSENEPPNENEHFNWKLLKTPNDLSSVQYNLFILFENALEHMHRVFAIPQASFDITLGVLGKFRQLHWLECLNNETSVTYCSFLEVFPEYAIQIRFKFDFSCLSFRRTGQKIRRLSANFPKCLISLSTNPSSSPKLASV